MGGFSVGGAVKIAEVSAESIIETEDKQFISAAEKEALMNKTQVFVGETEPDNIQSNDVWLKSED